MHTASVRGDRDAMRTILTILTFTDGAVAEGMPDVHAVVKKHPKMAKEIVFGNDRLKRKCGHWVQ